MTLHTRYDAVIVGGGHNGLVAAGYLAGAGLKVLLLERNRELGGATTSQRVFAGMDARLSRYAYLVSLLPQEIATELGLSFTGRTRAIAACSPFQRGAEDDAVVLSNVDPARSRTSVRRIAGDQGLRGYERFRLLERVFAQHVWPGYLQPLRSKEEWEASLATPELREAWEGFVERPLGGILERHIQDDVLRGLIFTDAKIGLLTHAHDPSLLQNRCFILHIVGDGTGEWNVPVGGMGELVQQLADTATKRGADLVTDATAFAISTGSQTHTVVFRYADRELEVEAERVLVNAGPQVLAQLLGKEYSPAPQDEGSVCKVNMLLRRLPRMRAPGLTPEDAFTGTFHLNETYDCMQASYEQAAGGSIPETTPAELYCHSLTDSSILGPELREAGYQTLTLFGLDAPYSLFTGDNEATKGEYLRRYLAELDRVLAEPIEDCLAREANGAPCIEIKSPRDLEAEIALNRGNIFHAAPGWFFAETEEDVGRWGVETAEERVYICGASASRGGGVSGIPGYAVARCIFEELGMPVQSAFSSGG